MQIQLKRLKTTLHREIRLKACVSVFQKYSHSHSHHLVCVACQVCNPFHLQDQFMLRGKIRDQSVTKMSQPLHYRGL